MQTREVDRFKVFQDRERNENLIDVLTAISIVSRRLAGRLTALERQRYAQARGGKCYDTRQSAANWK
jgi:hypothetical protein